MRSFLPERGKKKKGGSKGGVCVGFSCTGWGGLKGGYQRLGRLRVGVKEKGDLTESEGKRILGLGGDAIVLG